MKVIYKSNIKDRVDAAINEALRDGKSISRIELTDEEFFEFISLTNLLDTENVRFDRVEQSWTGSHINYRDICLQTHESYT